AAKPDQAASTATTASSSASMMVISRSRPLASAEPFSSCFSAALARCSEISFPTSPGDKPSGTAALLSDATYPACTSQSTASAGAGPHPTWVRFPGLAAGLLLLADGRHPPRAGDGLQQPLVIPLVLAGVGDREVRGGVVEVLAAAELAGDHRRPPGPGVRAGQRPAAEPAVVIELVGVHQGDAHASLHVPQLAHVVVLGRRQQLAVVTAAGSQAAGPAQERV